MEYKQVRDDASKHRGPDDNDNFSLRHVRLSILVHLGLNQWHLVMVYNFEEFNSHIIKAVDKFIGMFAIAFYEQTVTLIRDRVEPLS